jgi:hypothetical protein
VRKRLSIAVCLVAVLFGSTLQVEAATRSVCATGCEFNNLQTAIDAATFGDTILLRAGETYVGHFMLRAKSGTGWIEIRSDAASGSLPGDGVRLVPSDRPGGTTPRSLLPRIVGRGGAYVNTPVLRTEPGAHGYIIKFIEFDGDAQLGHGDLIALGEGTTATAPYDITMDRVYVHGHRYKGQRRGIALNARRVSVLNSYIADIASMSSDSQAICGWNGAGPFTIENNYLEASGENIMFGGADPAVTNLVPSDIVFRRNHFFKPLKWRNPILAAPASPQATAGGSGSLSAGTHYFRVVATMTVNTTTGVSVPSSQVSATVGAGGAVTVSWSAVAGADKYRVYRGTVSGTQTKYLETTGTSLVYTGAGEVSGGPAANGTKWVVKNLFELKNAARVTVEGNIFENSWEKDQKGYAIMLTPGNNGSAPWTRVQDVTFTNNIVRHVAGVVNISGYYSGVTSLRTERITFRNNLFEDINHTAYGPSAWAIVAGNGAASIVFEHNTIIHTSASVLFAYGSPTMPGLVYRHNISQHHTYGIMGTGASTGTPTLTRYFPGAVVQCNVLAGGNPSVYPTPNGFPTVAEWNASFVDAANGNYALKPASAVALAGCTGSVPGADLAAVLSGVGFGPGAPTNVRLVR